MVQEKEPAGAMAQEGKCCAYEEPHGATIDQMEPGYMW